MPGSVVAVAKSPEHSFSKPVCHSIRLLAGLGVEGDAHLGQTVKHRSRVRIDPSAPNLRQVHLIHSELLSELNARSFSIRPGEIGENILTEGIALLDLPRRTHLAIGSSALLEITGLRNPCRQLDDFQDGLLEAVLERGPDGALIRKAGIMAIVLKSGTVRAGDKISITYPDDPYEKLTRV